MYIPDIFATPYCNITATLLLTPGVIGLMRIISRLLFAASERASERRAKEGENWRSTRERETSFVKPLELCFSLYLHNQTLSLAILCYTKNMYVTCTAQCSPSLGPGADCNKVAESHGGQ